MPRSFDANVANYLDCGDAASAQITGTDITACVWARLFTTSGINNVFCKWGLSLNNHEWLITTASGFWNVWTMTSGAANYSNATGSAIKNGVWQHICLRQNSAGLSIFVDGKLIATNTTARSINNTTNRTLIGKAENGDAANGLLAHAAVWAEALTNDEILRLAQGASPQTIRFGGLRGYWRLDEIYNERDWSGRSLTATMAGAVSSRPDDVPMQIDPARQMLDRTSEPVAGVYDDFATVYVDIQASGADIADVSDSATVYVDIQPSGTDVRTLTDAETVYVDIQFLGGECFSSVSGLMMDAEADPRWTAGAGVRWQTMEVRPRWEVVEIQSEGVLC